MTKVVRHEWSLGPPTVKASMGGIIGPKHGAELVSTKFCADGSISWI